MYKQEVSIILDRKIKALRKELNKLKRARRTRRAKARARYPVRHNVSYI